MIRYESDDQAVARVLRGLNGVLIDHGTAKVIAAGYNDNDTAPFVTTGAIPTYEDEDEDDYDYDDIDGPAEWLMDAIRHGVDSLTLSRQEAPLNALYAYLQERVAEGETGPVEGWVSLDIQRHVDYPHKDGALPDCWCSDDDDDEAPESAPLKAPGIKGREWRDLGGIVIDF